MLLVHSASYREEHFVGRGERCDRELGQLVKAFMCVVYEAGWGAIIKKGSGSYPDYVYELAASYRVQEGQNLTETLKVKINRV
jgi:hypothetical protein